MATTAARALHILIADDEAAVTQSLEYVLRYAGHRIESVSDGKQAYDRLTAEAADFDLLITDDAMPILTGLQLVQKLRAAKFPGKILVLSACLSPSREQAYREIGVDHIMHKPFDIAPLRLAVEQLGAALDTERQS